MHQAFDRGLDEQLHTHPPTWTVVPAPPRQFAPGDGEESIEPVAVRPASRRRPMYEAWTRLHQRLFALAAHLWAR